MKFDNQILGIVSVESKSRKNLDDDEYMELVSLYGKENVDNDLMVEILALYPEQEILDAQGLYVTITEQDLHDIKDASNEALKNKLGHGLARAKSWMRGQNVDNFDYITITEDHDLDVSKRMGFSNGKLKVKDYKGTPYLHVIAHIIKPEAKKNIKLGLYREVSATVRMDNTLKEISFVSNPALHQAGIFSERELNNLSPTLKINHTNQLIQSLKIIIQILIILKKN